MLAFRAVKYVIQMFSSTNRNRQQSPNVKSDKNNSGTISTDDIIEADFTEIKETEK